MSEGVCHNISQMCTPSPTSDTTIGTVINIRGKIKSRTFPNGIRLLTAIAIASSLSCHPFLHPTMALIPPPPLTRYHSPLASTRRHRPSYLSATNDDGTSTKMGFHLPTKSECDAICEQTAAFYRKNSKVEGSNIAIYSYRRASLDDFIKYKAFEFRGLCFVENQENSWERHLLMNKFFNINQTNGWMYEDVKDKDIISVTNKVDGSIISFVKFPNGKVRAKTKTSFDSKQAKVAQKLYDENLRLREFLEKCISQREVPIFELVSPKDKIVLAYPDTDLVLLQIRTENGDYVSQKIATYADEFGISCRKEFNDDYYKSLDYLLEQKEKNQEQIEGWVVTFDDGQMAKIKTNEYLSLTGQMDPGNFRLNLAAILDGNIDDIISAYSGRERKELEKLNETVEKIFNNYVVEYIRLHDEFCNKYDRNRREFAIKYSKQYPLFNTFMRNLQDVEEKGIEKVAERCIKEFIKEKCKTQSMAEAFFDGPQ